MAKCDLCGNKVEHTFLGKLVGTYVKDGSGKKKIVCPDCQKAGRQIEIKKD